MLNSGSNPPLNPNHLDTMNRLGRAMADVTRSRILLKLIEAPAYPAELAAELSLTRPNVSNHLACLRDCGIVVASLEGRRTLYALSSPQLHELLTALVAIALPSNAEASCLVPECAR